MRRQNASIINPEKKKTELLAMLQDCSNLIMEKNDLIQSQSAKLERVKELANGACLTEYGYVVSAGKILEIINS